MNKFFHFFVCLLSVSCLSNRQVPTDSIKHFSLYWASDSTGELGYRDSITQILGAAGIISLGENYSNIMERLGSPNKKTSISDNRIYTIYYTLTVCEHAQTYKELFVQFKNRKVKQFAIWNAPCKPPAEG